MDLCHGRDLLCYVTHILPTNFTWVSCDSEHSLPNSSAKSCSKEKKRRKQKEQNCDINWKGNLAGSNRVGMQPWVKIWAWTEIQNSGSFSSSTSLLYKLGEQKSNVRANAEIQQTIVETGARKWQCQRETENQHSQTGCECSFDQRHEHGLRALYVKDLTVVKTGEKYNNSNNVAAKTEIQQSQRGCEYFGDQRHEHEHGFREGSAG